MPIYATPNRFRRASLYYNDVIMSAMASQITSVSIVYSTICSGADQRKHQGSVSLVFARGIHRWSVLNSSHKGPVTRKMFPSDDVIVVLYIFEAECRGHAPWRLDNRPRRACYWKWKINCLYANVCVVSSQTEEFDLMTIQEYLSWNNINHCVMMSWRGEVMKWLWLNDNIWRFGTLGCWSVMLWCIWTYMFTCVVICVSFIRIPVCMCVCIILSFHFLYIIIVK